MGTGEAKTIRSHINVLEFSVLKLWSWTNERKGPSIIVS